ncbi:putative chemotaxis transducer [Pseudomonas aeruginosa]|nr:putative chemotaxis transducer [Pseudomonas aeruginosa]
MYDWWVLQLAKLSVSRKLMLGFGVLLALLLLVVVSSNRTLTHQTALSEQLAEVATLMEQAQQAEQAHMAFDAGSDPRQAERLRRILTGMLERLRQLRDSELDPAALAREAEAIEAYRGPSTTSPPPTSSAAPPAVCWWAARNRRWTASPAWKN